MVRRFLPGLMVVLLSGCSSVSYYSQLASGQWQLLRARAGGAGHCRPFPPTAVARTLGAITKSAHVRQ